MEGSGVYVSCKEHKVDWIVVKAICDWGDGHKSKNKELRQKRAARSAAGFLVHALQNITLNPLMDDYPRQTAGTSQALFTQLFNLTPFPGWGMNSIHLEREKHEQNGSFWVNATFHSLV